MYLFGSFLPVLVLMFFFSLGTWDFSGGELFTAVVNVSNCEHFTADINAVWDRLESVSVAD